MGKAALSALALLSMSFVAVGCYLMLLISEVAEGLHVLFLYFLFSPFP